MLGKFDVLSLIQITVVHHLESKVEKQFLNVFSGF